MFVSEALEIFGMGSISDVVNTDIKKIYRKLMVKYHPDNCGVNDGTVDKIYKAYNILKGAKESGVGNVVVRESFVIDFEQLFEIYKKGKMVFRSREKKKEVTIGDLKASESLISFIIKIGVNGENEEHSFIRKMNTSDNYDFDIDVYVDELGLEDEIRIRVHDKDITYKIKSNSVTVKLKYEYNVCLSVRVNKRLRT